MDNDAYDDTPDAPLTTEQRLLKVERAEEARKERGRVLVGVIFATIAAVVGLLGWYQSTR